MTPPEPGTATSHRLPGATRSAKDVPLTDKSVGLSQRDRLVALGSLVTVSVLAWVYLWLEAAHMGMDMGSMPQAEPVSVWSVRSLALNFLMWAVMMVGMMLPSASPAILLFAGMTSKSAGRGFVMPGAAVFSAGYVAIWALFSIGATLLQAALQSNALITTMLVSGSDKLTGALLVLAGVYQLLPFKERCLQKCRSPLQFFMFRWRGGTWGAFLMGAEHGAYCVGCCWAIMLLLFTAGVMNLLWVALIAAFVFIEKVLAAGQSVSRASGAILIGTGALFLLG